MEQGSKLAAKSRREVLTGSASAAAAGLLLQLGFPSTVLAKAPLSGTQAPAFYRIKVGDIEVTALLDGFAPFTSDQLLGMFANMPADVARTLAEKNAGALSEVRLPINAYVVNTGGKLVLVDSGAASVFGPTVGKLPAMLKAAGIDPKDVDQVLLTHAHPDHIAGIVDAAGAASFPNAEVAISAAEHKFWTDDANKTRVPEGHRPFFDVVAKSLAPYKDRLQLLGGEKEAVSGITAVALPGHTPGHIGYRLSSGKDQLLIWGDTLHVAAWQFDKPEWSIAFDLDPEQSAETRRRTLDMAASDRLLVAGMHLPFPGLGRVAREGQGFRYVPTAWQPL